MTTTKKENTLFSYLFFGLFILLAFVKTDNLLDENLLPRFALLGGANVAVALLAWRKLKEVKLPLLLSLAAALFLIVQLISISAATNTLESYATLMRYGIIFSFLLLVLALTRAGLLKLQTLVQSGILLSGLAAIVTLFQLLSSLGSGDFFEDIYAITGTFSHKNLLASALMLGLPFALAGWSTLSKTWRGASLAIAVIIVMEIFVLRTRGVWLGTFGAALLTGILYFFTKKQGEKLPLKWVAGLSGLALIILIGLFSSPQIKAGFLNSSNVQKRLAFWENSVEMLKENPALGVGAGNWKIIFPKHGLQALDRSVMQGITHIQRPHNDYLWVWAEAGPLALLAYLALFVLPLFQVIKNLRSSENDTERKINYFAFFAIVAYGLFSFGDFPLERAPHSVLFFSAIALVYGSGASRYKTLNIKVLPLLTLVISALSLFVLSYRWQGEKASGAILEANARQDAQAIIPAAENALNDFYNMDAYANPIRYYSGLGYLFTNRPDRALEEIKLAKEAAPYNILVYQSFANAYSRKNQPDLAVQYLDSALAISPKYESAMLLKAEILLKEKKPVEALAVLNYFPPQSNNQRYLNALARALRGSLQSYPQHGRFKPVMEHLRQQGNLQQPMDYIRAYRQAIAQKN